MEKGDRTFEMTEPDEDGEMEISVDDGSGEPKEYKLDFGDGENDEGGQSESGDFGPTGAGGGAEEEVHRPGEDGKIHIEDGDLKITAERPEGPDGPTRVTVDDGTPPPTTYTLGEAKDEESGATGGAGMGAGTGGGADRGSPRTMPAPGENPFEDDEEADADKGVPAVGSGGGVGGTAASGGGSISDGGAMAGGSGGSAGEGGGGGTTRRAACPDTQVLPRGGAARARPRGAETTTATAAGATSSRRGLRRRGLLEQQLDAMNTASHPVVAKRADDIRCLVCRVLEVDADRVEDTDLFVETLGADSMKLIELLAHLEIEFDVEVDEDEIERLVNIEGVFAVLSAALGG